jgi:hypothetical protein
MWTYNVARELIRRAGLVPWPIRIPPDPIPVFRQAVTNNVAASDVICIKVHSRFEGRLPQLKVLCNVRDARDALTSWMRFTHCNFDSALEGFSESLELTDYYLGTSDLAVLPVRYEELMHKQGEPVIQRIGDFLGFPISTGDVQSIAAAYSRDSIRRRTPAEAGTHAGAATGVTIANEDGTLREYDEATGFQSGHVSESRDGEWRTLLDDSQQQRLMAVVQTWLVRHGYPLDP